MASSKVGLQDCWDYLRLFRVMKQPFFEYLAVVPSTWINWWDCDTLHRLKPHVSWNLQSSEEYWH